MPTPAEHHATLQTLIANYRTVKTQAQAEVEAAQAKAQADIAAAKAQVQAGIEAAAPDVPLAEGETVSLGDRVPVLTRRNGQLQYETLKSLADLAPAS